MMKLIFTVLLALAGVVLSACVPSAPSSLLDIEIRQTDFVINGHSFATIGELTTALKKLPPPDGVNLIHTRGISPERRNQVIVAVKNSGIKTPIGWVGNEVFH